MNTMTSECPKCHKQIEHEDYLFEVRCTGCNCRFNPFMAAGAETPAEEPPAAPVPEPPPAPVAAAIPEPEPEPEPFPSFESPPPSDEPNALDNPFELSLDATPSAPTEPPPEANFGELNFDLQMDTPQEPTPSAPGVSDSASAFAEIVDFGESLGTPNEQPVFTPPPAAPAAKAPAKGAPKAAPKVQYAPLPDGEECPVTAGDAFQGFVIEKYFAPLSAMQALDPNHPDPLRAAFDALSANARAQGANGLVAMRWSITNDSSKVLVTATPVRIGKGS